MTEGTRKRTDFLFLQKAGLTESEGPILVREEVGEKHIKPCAGAVSKNIIFLFCSHEHLNFERIMNSIRAYSQKEADLGSEPKTNKCLISK